MRRITRNRAADVDPAWSPDGRRIAFVSNRDGDQEIFTVGSRGGAVQRVTASPAGDIGPAWSPDGRRIAFRSDRDGNFEIYTANTDGSGIVRVTNAPAADSWPAWSPDGSRIAFASGRDGNLEIYTANPDGMGLVRVTNTRAAENFPKLSPDGSRIVFSDRDGNFELYTARVDGSGAVRSPGPRRRPVPRLAAGGPGQRRAAARPGAGERPGERAAPHAGHLRADRLRGTALGDRLIGLGGRDTLSGGPGADCLAARAPTASPGAPGTIGSTAAPASTASKAARATTPTPADRRRESVLAAPAATRCAPTARTACACERVRLRGRGVPQAAPSSTSTRSAACSYATARCWPGRSARPPGAELDHPGRRARSASRRCSSLRSAAGRAGSPKASPAGPRRPAPTQPARSIRRRYSLSPQAPHLGLQEVHPVDHEVVGEGGVRDLDDVGSPAGSGLAPGGHAVELLPALAQAVGLVQRPLDHGPRAWRAAPVPRRSWLASRSPTISRRDHCCAPVSSVCPARELVLGLRTTRHPQHVLAHVGQGWRRGDRRHLEQARLAELALHVVVRVVAVAAEGLHRGLGGAHAAAAVSSRAMLASAPAGSPRSKSSAARKRIRSAASTST